jgi:hypothetical protein
MNNRIDLDVHFLEQEIVNLIASYPEMEEDDSLKADMIEGSLDVEKVMSRILNHLFEADEMLDGMKPRFEDLAERKKRWERRKEFCRALAQRVLEASGRPSIQLPEATVAKSKGKESVEITNLELIPQGFYETEKTAKKAEIKKALDAGQEVPGAKLTIGAGSIRINTK